MSAVMEKCSTQIFRELARVERSRLPRLEGGDSLYDKVRPHLPETIGTAHAKKGRPYGRPFLVEAVGQRLFPKVGVTEPTGACCWMSCTHWLWPRSACAGPARPRTAAARPLATMVANPNFFILMPSSFPVRFGRFGPLRAGLTD